MSKNLQSKKLTDNGLYKSSRIILPEHREALVTHRFKKQQRKVRPYLDPKTLEDIAAAVARSFHDRQPVTLTVFDILDYEKTFTGIVTKIDQQQQLLKLERSSAGVEWVPFEDVISAEI